MADRSVTVRLKAEVGQYQAAMAQAGAATEKANASMQRAGGSASSMGKATQGASADMSRAADGAGKLADGVNSAATEASTATGAMGKLAQAQRQHSEEWARVSTVALGAGAAITAGVGGIVKAAMSWESAWTGVKKTVDGTPQQLAAVEDGLRGLARELPASHEEIAGVAEAAGQLGVKTGDVVAFTKTMIDMGESTNLTADEAATGIAHFTNIMGSLETYGTSAFSRIGSAMVELGNNFATTESEILAMGLRLASTGWQVGLTEGEVLGLAAAMSSVGIEAEAGGTAMSTGMKKIDKAARHGGDALEGFARVAGVSSEEFARKWRENSAAALDDFVHGLMRVDQGGGSVSATLDELGITGNREQDTFMRLAGAADVLTDALGHGNQGLRENTALAEEASKRYETTESRIRIAWNSIKDVAISAGASLLPIVASVSDAVAGVAGTFADLPSPITAAATVIAGLAGAGLLAVGGLMKIVSAAASTKAAMDTLGIAVDLNKRKLGKIGLAAGAVSLALIGISAAGKMAERGTIGLESISKVMDANGKSIEGLNQKFANAKWADYSFWGGGVEGIDGVGSAVQKLAEGSKWNDLNAHVGHFLGYNTSWADLQEDVSSLDKSLATMVTSGNMEAAGKNFEQITQEARKAGVSAKDLISVFPELSTAVDDYAASLEVTLTPQEKLDAMMGKIPPKLAEAAGGADKAAAGMAGLGGEAGEAAESLDDVVESLHELGILFVDEQQAIGDYYEALDGVGDVLKRVAESGGAMGDILDANTGQLDMTTEAGRAAFDAFAELNDAGWDTVKAMAANDASQEALQGQLKKTYDDLYNTGLRFGLTADDADTLARKVMDIPKGANIDSWMSDSAMQMAEKTTQALNRVPNQKNVNVTVTTNYIERHSTLGRISTGRKRRTGVPLRREYWKNSGGLVGEPTPGYARGGLLPGVPPVDRWEDNLPALIEDTGQLIRVRSREFVVNEQATDENLGLLRWINGGGNAMDLLKGVGIPGLARGGSIRLADGSSYPGPPVMDAGLWRRLARQHPDRIYYEDGTWSARSGRGRGVWWPEWHQYWKARESAEKAAQARQVKSTNRGARKSPATRAGASSSRTQRTFQDQDRARAEQVAQKAADLAAALRGWSYGGSSQPDRTVKGFNAAGSEVTLLRAINQVANRPQVITVDGRKLAEVQASNARRFNRGIGGG